MHNFLQLINVFHDVGYIPHSVYKIFLILIVLVVED